MNVVDFLKLRALKNRFSRENLTVLWFSFFYTWLVVSTLHFIFNIFSTAPKIKDFLLNGLPVNIMLFVFVGLIFLTSVALGFKLSERKVLLRKNRICIKEGNFSNKKLSNLFDFQGVLSDNYNNQNCLYLCNSYEGLLTKCNFRNPKIIFSAEISNDGFAFIISAKDFENYLMFRIMLKVEDEGKERMYIIPHLRRFGIWEIQNIKHEKEAAFNNVKAGDRLDFEVNVWDKSVKIIIRKNTAILKNFNYLIPSHFALLPSDQNDSGGGSPKYANVVSDSGLSSFGKVGFRATGQNEKAIILSLDISEYNNNYDKNI